MSRGCSTALLDGMVQGVVVQITTGMRKDRRRVWSRALGVTRNFTQIGEAWLSWYSTSASASAVFSTGDHITGFEPW
jgi:hypothetical protein